MPTPIRWQGRARAESPKKRVAAKLCRISKLYVFLREIRAELFDEAFETELAAAYQPRGMTTVMSFPFTNATSGFGSSMECKVREPGRI